MFFDEAVLSCKSLATEDSINLDVADRSCNTCSSNLRYRILYFRYNKISGPFCSPHHKSNFTFLHAPTHPPRGIGLAVTKQPPTVTELHLQSLNESTAPHQIFVQKYALKVRFASLKSIFLEKDLRESVKLTKNLYFSRFFPRKMQK